MIGDVLVVLLVSVLTTHYTQTYEEFLTRTEAAMHMLQL